MKVTFESSGNFKETIDWLNQTSRKVPSRSIQEISNDGVNSLRANTPIGETGETAQGWHSKIETKGSVTEVSFMNSAHPESSVNVAKLIDIGHGTGTGGYVQPRPYIKQSMEEIFETAGDKIIKEMIE